MYAVVHVAGKTTRRRLDAGASFHHGRRCPRVFRTPPCSILRKSHEQCFRLRTAFPLHRVTSFWPGATGEETRNEICANPVRADQQETTRKRSVVLGLLRPSVHVCFSPNVYRRPLGLSVKHASRRKPLNIARAHLYAAATALNSHTKT